MGIYTEYFKNQAAILEFVANDIIAHGMSSCVLEHVIANQADFNIKVCTPTHVELQSKKLPTLMMGVWSNEEHPLPGDFHKDYMDIVSGMYIPKADFQKYLEHFGDSDKELLKKLPNNVEIEPSDIKERPAYHPIDSVITDYRPFDTVITKEQTVTEILNFSKALNDAFGLNRNNDIYREYPESQKDNPFFACVLIQECVKAAYRQTDGDREKVDPIVIGFAHKTSEVLRQSIFNAIMVASGYTTEDALDKLYRGYEIRANWKEALMGVKSGTELSYYIDYGFYSKDLQILAEIHRDNEDLRKKIEDLLEDCNLHNECDNFSKGNYDKFLNIEPQDELED